MGVVRRGLTGGRRESFFQKPGFSPPVTGCRHDSSSETIFIVPAQGAAVGAFIGSLWCGNPFSMKGVILSAVFELFPNASTDLEIETGCYRHATGVEQLVGIASQHLKPVVICDSDYKFGVHRFPFPLKVPASPADCLTRVSFFCPGMKQVPIIAGCPVHTLKEESYENVQRLQDVSLSYPIQGTGTGHEPGTCGNRYSP